MTTYYNAEIINGNERFTGNFTVKEGRIVSVEKGAPSHVANAVDVCGMSVIPAFIDLHAHLRTPGLSYKEDFVTGLNAALKGGYGTVCAMANTNPVIDTLELLQENNISANALKKVRYIQIAAAGLGLKDESFVDFAAIAPYAPLISNDGNTIFSEEFMKKCLIASEEFGFIICTHCQPEEEIVARDLRLLAEVGGNLHICHISTRRTTELVKTAKEKGLAFTCEVTPHHLFGYDLDYKVNPPIAAKDDVDALIDGIRAGYVDMLATDHAPHTQQDKMDGAPGISVIETAFSMYNKVFYDNGISVQKLIEMACERPAKLLKLNRGRIEAGYEADFVIADFSTESEIHKDEFVSKSNNTPFDGYKTRGKIIKTIIGGEVKYDSK